MTEMKGLGKALAALLLVAFIAEPVPIGVVVSGASPINQGYDGTSSLVATLKNLGYDVRLVESWGIAWLTSRTDACRVLFIISPERPFTFEEVITVSAFIRGGAHLIVADEGSYSNAILGSLGLEARISGEHVSFDGSYIFPVRVNLSGFNTAVYLAYASSVRRGGNDVTIASRSSVVLGIRTTVGGSVVYVFGDGSIFTNAVLAGASSSNPYIQLLKTILADTCPTGTVYIDSAKYGFRALTTSEVLSLGNLSYAIAALSNPFRYALMASQNTDPAIMSMIILATLTIVATSFLDQVLPLKGVAQTPLEDLTQLRRRGRVTRTLRELVCSEEAPEKLRKVCSGARVLLSSDDVEWLIART